MQHAYVLLRFCLLSLSQSIWNFRLRAGKCVYFASVIWSLIRFLNSQAKDHTCRLVQSAVESGARLILDGRYIIVCYQTQPKYSS